MRGCCRLFVAEEQSPSPLHPFITAEKSSSLGEGSPSLPSSLRKSRRRPLVAEERSSSLGRGLGKGSSSPLHHCREVAAPLRR